jgi:hypothetical protein
MGGGGDGGELDFRIALVPMCFVYLKHAIMHCQFFLSLGTCIYFLRPSLGEFLAGLRIRIHFIRIRIQHFRMNTDPDPIRIQGFNDQKLKKITAEKNCNLPIPRPP